eukprot:1575157-Ditylum_brightwellii.AAC.1
MHAEGMATSGGTDTDYEDVIFSWEDAEDAAAEMAAEEGPKTAAEEAAAVAMEIDKKKGKREHENNKTGKIKQGKVERGVQLNADDISNEASMPDQSKR